MFKIIKKGNGNFWHNFNNGSKEVNLSNWEIVLDSINQTVSLQMLNGANVPINSVNIADVVVIDETDISLEETFGSVNALRTRLIELNYTPYIILNGFVPEAPIDGLTYGRKDAGWVEVTGGGGSTPDATTTVKGKLKLAGDLAGTADLPTVPALADKEETSNKGIANGYVPLNSSTEIDLAYFPDAILGQLLYGGVVNISTAVATLTNNAKTKLGTVLSTITLTNDATAITGYTANEGIYYIATVSGTFAGISFEVGDWLVSIGSAWVKVDNTDAISSFNTRTGAITLLNTDVLPLVLSGLSAASGTFTSSDTILTAFGKIKYLIDNIASTYQAILTDVNFGSFSNGLTAKTTPVDADTINISDSADSNKAKKVSFTNFKAFLKTYFDGLYSVPCITITTSSSIDTDTTGSGYGQHGRNTKIANSTNAINLTVQTTSNADFVASYTKIGTATITFVAGSGATLVQLSGTAALTGSVGSTACLTRNGNTYYLQITNY